jgi:hypothetical protein
MTRRMRSLGLVAAALVLAAVSGCGVRLQDQAEPLPSGALPAEQSPVPATQSTRESKVYFVNGRGLEAVREALLDHSPEGVLATLAAGPPVTGSGSSPLRSLLVDPLTRQPVLAVTRVTGDGQVVLQHTDAYLTLSPGDQVLLMGQVTSSLGDAGYPSVLLTDPDNQRVAISLPDGRVREGAVTAGDYSRLIVNP